MDNHLLNIYNRLPIQFERGEGAYVFDTEGNKLLDAFSGIAVSGLGYNHPAITKTISEQAKKLIHISNLVEIPQQMELSNILVEKFGEDARVFFSNSGAEAVEAVAKIARLYGHSKNIDVPKVAVMSNAFHGRTNAAIAMAGSDKVKAGFEPLLPGFVQVEYNNSSSLLQAIKEDNDIVGVFLEPIQGESGINVPASDYLNEVRAICDEHGLLMMVDEIQSGIGRTGKFFCFEHNGIVPDVVTLAKGLANGVPIGATIIRGPHFELFKPGSHGSTFGGNPLSCATAITVINELYKSDLMDNALTQGQFIIEGLRSALGNNKHVVDIRGKGLMIGIELDKPARGILPSAIKAGLLFNTAGTHVVRLLPPLIYTEVESKKIVDTLPKVIQEYCDS